MIASKKLMVDSELIKTIIVMKKILLLLLVTMSMVACSGFEMGNHILTDTYKKYNDSPGSIMRPYIVVKIKKRTKETSIYYADRGIDVLDIKDKITFIEINGKHNVGDTLSIIIN